MTLDRRARYVACVSAGALMACATPPMNLYPMAWLGMVALAWLLADATEHAPTVSLPRMGWSVGSMGFLFAFGTI